MKLAASTLSIRSSGDCEEAAGDPHEALECWEDPMPWAREAAAAQRIKEPEKGCEYEI